MHHRFKDILDQLMSSDASFIDVFKTGAIHIELYVPGEKDNQKPHDRDEIYIIKNGIGHFYNDGETIKFNSGDVIFVEAWKEHYFFDYSNDFQTWVIFFGPIIKVPDQNR